jgi:hypothetical protein
MVAKIPSVQDPIPQVRALLHGTVVAVVGGDKRHAHSDRLCQTFELRGLLWVPTRESDASPSRFASVIAQDDIVLVVALLGLLRHQHTRDLRGLCKRFAVPHLVYWRSPHPRGLAAAIIAQHLVGSIAARRCS